MNRIDEFATRLFALNVYGTSLLMEKVRAEIAVFARILTIAFFVDAFAWTMVWHYALSSFGWAHWLLALPLGLAFAFAIVLYDRSIVVGDTTLSRDPDAGFRIPFTTKRISMSRVGMSFLMRFMLLLFLATITAIPVEITVFHSEIENRISRTEEARVADIRARAITSENERFGREIATLRAEGAERMRPLREERARARSVLETSRATQRADMQATIDHTNARTIDESRGTGPSGRRGAGNVYRALLNQGAGLQQQLVAFNAQTERDLASFDNHTRELLQDETDRVNASVARVQQMADTRINEVRAMPAPALAQRFNGGEYREPRGFLQRFRTLEAMRREDPFVNLVVAMFRGVMIAFGLIILGLKILTSQETRRYFSLGAQASEGQLDAVRVVKGMGYANVAKFGVEQEVRDATKLFLDACDECATKIHLYWKQCGEIASTKDATGLHLTHTEAVMRLRREWEHTVRESILAVDRKARHMVELGMTPPMWPEGLNEGVDPRGSQYRPWDLDETRLMTLGWVNPEPEKNRLDELEKELSKARIALVKLASKAKIDLEEAVRSEGFNETQVLRARYDLWTESVIPLLDKIRFAEEGLRRAGRSISWPSDLTDPRPSIQGEILNIEERVKTLRPSTLNEELFRESPSRSARPPSGERS